jgi:hypothetical protein
LFCGITTGQRIGSPIIVMFRVELKYIENSRDCPGYFEVSEKHINFMDKIIGGWRTNSEQM